MGTPSAIVWLLLTVALEASGAPEPAATPRPRTVILLNSDRGPADVEEIFRARLQAIPGGVNLVTENVDLYQVENEDYASRLSELLRRKYIDRGVALVIPVQIPAIRFMGKYGATAFPDIPVVFCAADSERLAATPLPPTIAGKTGRVAILETVEAALQLHPGTRQVVVVSGETPSDRYWRQRVKDDLRPLDPRVDVVAPERLPMPTLLDRLRRLPDHAIVLFVNLSQDGAGSSYSTDAARLVGEASRVPVYALHEGAFGSGVVGGRMYSYEREAEKAAGVALRVLSGERPQDIGVTWVDSTAFVFDWRQLQRWHLSESRLPAGSIVRFRPPSAWALYRGWILGGIALVLVLSSLVVGLLIERVARRRAEAELDERCRFETLLSDLTRSLTQADVAALDAEIGSALRRLGEALALDRVEVGQFRPGRRDVEMTHSWPEAADPAGQESVIVPLSVGGAALGTLGLAMHRPGRPWPRELLNRLRLAGEILASALMRQRFETVVAEREGVSTALFASLYGRVAVLDRAGHIVAVNDAWIRSARSTPDAGGGGGLVGGNYVEMCRAAAETDGPAAVSVLQGLTTVLDGGAPHFSTEYRLPSAGGDGWVRVLVEPLNRSDGGAVVTLVDVTDRKRAEMEAGRLREDLAHMVRVSTLGELAASLAHELNQPLTAILSNVQAAQMLLGRDSPDLDQIREILGEVVTDDKRAGEVIQGLRALFKKGQREKGRLDLNALVRDVSRLVHNDAAMLGVALRLDLDPGLPAVEGDPIQIQQVILNLAINGLDAVRDRPNGERHLAIRSSMLGSSARIEVADSGAGIAADDRHRLFEPFFTTKAGGMGMGLAIARSIVEAHGGSLSVADKSDRGSTFLAVFPTHVSV